MSNYTFILCLFLIDIAAIDASKSVDNDFEVSVRKKCAGNLGILANLSVSDSVSTMKPESIGSMVKLVTEKPEQIDLDSAQQVVGALKNLVILTQGEKLTDTTKKTILNAICK